MRIEEILTVKHLSVEFQTSDGKKQVGTAEMGDLIAGHIA